MRTKILFLCGREASYPLNQVLIQLLSKFSDLTVINEGGSGKSILKRSSKVLLLSLPHLLSKKFDLVFVGFYGHFIMLPLRFLTRTPVLFHPFISTYETLILDRKKASPQSLTAKISYWVDKTACHFADNILLDTDANVQYFSETFDLPINMFETLFIGSDEKLFYPRSIPNSSPTINVLYHGSYLPLQGIDTIIKAAQLLQNYPLIQFTLLGTGLEYNHIQKMVKDLNVKNVHFRPSVPVNKLPEEICQASICLGGHFGTSEKAKRVIAGKTFQDIAMGKATIVGDNKANRELLTHRYDAWLCPMDDPNSLADAILTLATDNDLREQIGYNAHNTFIQKASLETLEDQLKEIVEKTAMNRKPS